MTSTIIQSSKGLSNEQIASRCPSVYAPSKHESRSDRYLYIPTGTIIDGMRQEGFMPTYVAQAQARREDMTNFTKHLIRFRGVNDLGPLAVGQEFFEIVMINSHNGGNRGHTGYRMSKVTAIAPQGDIVIVSLECGHTDAWEPYHGYTAEEWAWHVQYGPTPTIEVGKTRLRCTKQH